MTPKIKFTKEILLVGKQISMSYSNNLTPILWKSFMPHRKQTPNVLSNKLYSVEIYKNESYFEAFDPTAEFEKWAAVEVSNLEAVSLEMKSLVIPSGKYAIFKYKGKGSEASETYRSIIQDWFPRSIYQLDHRPHFAVMGEKYKFEDANSEEELWFPVKDKE